MVSFCVIEMFLSNEWYSFALWYVNNSDQASSPYYDKKKILNILIVRFVIRSDPRMKIYFAFLFLAFFQVLDGFHVFSIRDFHLLSQYSHQSLHHHITTQFLNRFFPMSRKIQTRNKRKNSLLYWNQMWSREKIKRYWTQQNSRFRCFLLFCLRFNYLSPMYPQTQHRHTYH